MPAFHTRAGNTSHGRRPSVRACTCLWQDNSAKIAERFLWRARPDEAHLVRRASQSARVAYVPASRLIRGSLRAGLHDAGCWLLRHLNDGYAVRGGTRAVPGSRAGAGRCHRFSARTAVVAAGAEDQHDRYQSGRRQQPQQQQRGPLETQTPAYPAQAGALPGVPEPPQSPLRTRQDHFPVRHLLARRQSGERRQQRR